MQKRVNIADQRLLSSKCPVRKVSPWLASGILDLGNVPTNLIDRSGSLCLSYENNRVYAILEHAKQRVPTWSNSKRNFGHGASDELPWQTTFHVYCSSLLQEDLRVSCVTPLGKDSWMLRPGFQQTSPHMPFPLLMLLCILLL